MGNLVPRRRPASAITSTAFPRCRREAYLLRAASAPPLSNRTRITIVDPSKPETVNDAPAPGSGATPLVLLDRDGTIVHLNPGLAELTGWSDGEARGHTMSALLIPEPDRPGFGDLLHRVLAGEDEGELRIRVRDRDGGVHGGRWRFTAFGNGADGSMGILGTAVGASPREAREKREGALRESHARFAGIVEIASDAIISVNREHRIVLFNQGAEWIFGYRKEEVLGQSLDLLLPVRSRTAHRKHIDNFGESPVPARRMAERQTISGLRRNGEEFAAEASIQKIVVEGEPFYTVVLRDVSERVRHDQAQAFLSRVGDVLARTLDQDETLRQIVDLTVESVTDLCMITVAADEEGDRRRVEARHRLPAGADLASRLARIMAEEPLPGLLEGVLQGDPHVFHPEVGSEEIVSLAKSDDTAALLLELEARSILVVPLQARGRLLGTLLCLRCGATTPQPGRPFHHRPYDNADLELALELGRRAGMAVDNARLYREARRAVEARDEVLGIVSHDLGNPLQAIFIGLESMERSRAGRATGRPGQEEYYLTAIRRSVEVMERLIQDLLEVRRMESGHLQLDPQPRSLGPLVEEALEMLVPLARVKNIRVLNEVPAEGLPMVRVDGDRIQQVLSNLVGNAVKHTPEEGEVCLQCEVTADELRIHVRDTGSGIPPEDLARVFDRFWRAGKRRGRGIGLGLAIARGIVRSHGGRIWAESEVGTGSTFSFALPLDRAKTDSAPAGPPDEEPSAGG